MKWTRRRFNPNTLRIEQVPLTRKEIVRGVVVRLFSVVAIGATSVWLFDQVFQSPADRARDREIAFLEGQLESMRGDVSMMEAAMEDMAHRDDAVYRALASRNTQAERQPLEALVLVLHARRDLPCPRSLDLGRIVG